MAIGRFNLMPRPGLEATVRFDICENAAFTNLAIKAIYAAFTNFAIKAIYAMRNNNWIKTQRSHTVNLVMNLRIAHECFGSGSTPSLNGHLYYPAPADINKTLNGDAPEKTLTLFLSCLLLLLLANTSGSLHTVSLCAFYFCRLTESGN